MSHQMRSGNDGGVRVAILRDVHPASEVPEIWRGRFACSQTMTNYNHEKKCQNAPVCLLGFHCKKIPSSARLTLLSIYKKFSAFTFDLSCFQNTCLIRLSYVFEVN